MRISLLANKEEQSCLVLVYSEIDQGHRVNCLICPVILEKVSKIELHKSCSFGHI